jgi:hypothetical protein
MPEYRGRTYLPNHQLPNGAKLWTRKESVKKAIVPAKTHELAYPAGYWVSSDMLPENQKVGFRPGDLVWWVGPVRSRAFAMVGIKGYTAVPFLVLKMKNLINEYSVELLGPNELRYGCRYNRYAGWNESRVNDLYFEKKKHPVYCDEGLKVIGWEFAE